MARFPYYRRNTADLGRLLAKANLNPDFAEKLKSAPRSVLAALGLPAQTTELIDFKVVDERDCYKARVLPFKLNPAKLSSADVSYVTSVAKLLS